MGKTKKRQKKQVRSAAPDPVNALHRMNIKAGQIRPGEFPTDRFVAFIDILGFRDLIGRMFSDEPSLFATLLTALQIAKAMAEGVDPENVRTVTAFSDSIVISEGGLMIARQLSRFALSVECERRECSMRPGSNGVPQEKSDERGYPRRMRVYYECQSCTACCRWPGQVCLNDELATASLPHETAHLSQS